MNRKFIIISLCYLISISIICRYALSSKNADWLIVGTPSHALCENSFDVSVTLLNPQPGMYLSVDLHWMTSDKESNGYLSGTKPVMITAGRKVYDFSVPVTRAEKAAYIFPVIILSREGTWNSRISAAEMEPVSVTNSGKVTYDSTLSQRSVKDTSGNEIFTRNESVHFRFLITGIWFAAVVLYTIKRKNLGTTSIAITAFISSLWEGLNAGWLLENSLRIITTHAGAYGERHEPQQIVSVFILIAIGIFSIYLISTLTNMLKILSWICLSVFWCISILQIISLHEIDELLYSTFIGLEIGQMIKLAASFVFLAITVNTIRSDKKRSENYS